MAATGVHAGNTPWGGLQSLTVAKTVPTHVRVHVKSPGGPCLHYDTALQQKGGGGWAKLGEVITKGAKETQMQWGQPSLTLAQATCWK